MLKRFIKRPVLSTVISVIIVILGILGVVSLPISQYPEIAPPTISVSASYGGANADVVLKSVIVPLEQQINGVQDMDYMTSTAGNDGTATIMVVFKVGTNPDIDAVNVQNLVARASQLPQEVIRSGITVRKRMPSDLLIFSVYSDNPAYDQTFLQNYVDINIVPQIKRISGVGDAVAAGSMDYAMRIWLKPDVMAAYGVVPADVTAALAEQNIQAAPGQFGEQGGQSFQTVIRYTGTLIDTTQFGNIIIRSVGTQEHVLRLKDIARIELGAMSYAVATRTNNKPGVAVTVMQSSGSNAQQVIQQSLAVLQKASASFPAGIKYVILSNANDFLVASIDKVLHTLVEASILVFLVVLLFLQDLRSTLIPAIAVPVAIVGTFFFLNMFGFTINLLTLFAMILAIGIVVDDAIVVVEAVHAKLDQGYKSPKKASIDAMNEISGAIVSITLVMAAVFVPVSFIGGSAGVFYKQFGLTLAIAIILSAINALTLSPALCALFLKPHDKEHKKRSVVQRFYLSFNTAFESLTGKYKKSITFLSKKKWIPVTVLALFTAVFFFLSNSIPKSFVPAEDLGVITADISLPPSASLERTNSVVAQVEKISHTIPEITNIVAVIGSGSLSGNGSNYGRVVMRLSAWNQRSRNVQAIIAELTNKISGISEAKIVFLTPPTIQGFGNSGGFSLQLEDRTGGDIALFYKISSDFLKALNQRPEIQFASTPFNPNFPQYLLNVDVAKVKAAGLKVSDVLDAMQGYFGGLYASNFNQFGQQFRVMIQADPAYRAKPENLNSIFVRNASGTMAPITEFISLQNTFGPQSISRFNLFTSIAVNGSPKQGYSSGNAITAIQQVAAQTFPAGYSYEYSGLTRQELSAGSQTTFIFLLCLIFVYFLLSAQYESYILPFSILLTLPIGLAGAFLFAKIFGIDDNIYVQITLIMLIGLLAKNAILIVEFAVERRRLGMPLIEAALKGAEARLRPILMTSFAFILGLLPLMLATGAGANGNHAIGTGAIGGMLIGTTCGIFITPILFIIFQSLQEKISGPPKPDDDDDDENDNAKLNSFSDNGESQPSTMAFIKVLNSNQNPNSPK